MNEPPKIESSLAPLCQDTQSKHDYVETKSTISYKTFLTPLTST